MIGYLLSPLSWWNDLFVNVPLALVFAWAVSVFYPPAFTVACVVGYWLTNVIGLILLHKGTQQMLSAEKKPFDRRELIKDLLISLAYTALIVVLVQSGVLKPVQQYFNPR